MADNERVQTHSPICWQWHADCAAYRLLYPDEQCVHGVRFADPCAACETDEIKTWDAVELTHER